MNVNENLRRQLACASKRNSLLIAQSPSERKSLKILVAGGTAIEPIPGAFSLKEEYEHMNPRARERARIRAIHKLHPNWTFCLYSAAIAHGLQVPHALLDATHIAIAKGRNWRKAEPTIHSHVLHDPITTTSDGVPCTNISATVFEYLKARGGARKSPDDNLRSAIKAMRNERMRETSLNLAGMTVLRFSYADELDTDRFFSLLSTAGVPLA